MFREEWVLQARGGQHMGRETMDRTQELHSGIPEVTAKAQGPSAQAAHENHHRNFKKCDVKTLPWFRMSWKLQAGLQREKILLGCELPAVGSDHKTQSWDSWGSSVTGVTAGKKTPGCIPLVWPPFPECKSACLWYQKNVLTDLYPVSDSTVVYGGTRGDSRRINSVSHFLGPSDFL